VRHRRFGSGATLLFTLPLAAGCVPSGSAPQDAGTTSATAPVPRPTTTPVVPPPFVPPADTLKVPFEETFDRVTAADGGGADAGDAARPAFGGEVEVIPDWTTSSPQSWHIEGGKLCGEHAVNHGIWFKRALPMNARIEFDAISHSPDGDLKAEFWGDGRSHATARSYTNATSYLAIFGGWHNTFHVLARLDEHGTDRKEIKIDPSSDDPREKPVTASQSYHFKVERVDGRTIKWWVDNNEMLSWNDSAPLTGPGHDHFGFNDWEVKVCFDNVKIVPLP
jgi:hypothetical protein